MSISSATIRAFAVSAVLGVSAVSANAGLAIPLNFTVSDSVQVFPTLVMRAFKAVDIKVDAGGTATALDAPNIGNNSTTFDFPITRIVIGPRLNIANGSAVGSALIFKRDNDDGITKTLTLANFTIDYDRKQVLADTTHSGLPTSRQLPIYNFKVATPLGLKYQFPLNISGYEQLNDLRLTPEAKKAYTDGLELPVFALPSLESDFGTLSQTVSLKLRSTPISTRPYEAK